MYDIITLDSMELSEIRAIAQQLNVPRNDKLDKQELIYKILDFQALNPTQEILDQEKREVKRFRGRPRKNPEQPPRKKVHSGRPKNETRITSPVVDQKSNTTPNPVTFVEKAVIFPELVADPEPENDIPEVISTGIEEKPVTEEPTVQTEQPIPVAEEGTSAPPEEKKYREHHRKFQERPPREEYSFEFEGIVVTE